MNVVIYATVIHTKGFMWQIQLQSQVGGITTFLLKAKTLKIVLTFTVKESFLKNVVYEI